MSETIDNRIKDGKMAVIGRLIEMPVIQTACLNTNIGRATYYRWCKEDKNFKKEARVAIRRGVALINDLAESKLIAGIEGGDMRAIRYWLNNRHESYSFRNKITIADLVKNSREKTE